MKPNTYPGKCGCGRKVAALAGTLVKDGGRWGVKCVECLPPGDDAPVPPQERRLLEDGTVRTPRPSPEELALLRSFPGAKWDPGAACWRVSLAPADRARVLEIAAILRLEVAPALTTIALPPEVQVRAAAATAAGAYPYQRAGVEWLGLGTRRLLADEMGLGKTMQALMSLPPGGATLVVCPAAVKYVWREEARRWRPDLTVRVLDGRGAFRWPAAGEVLVINPDILPALPETEPRHPDVTLVVDEAHAYKSHKAQRSQKIRTIGERCGRTIAMTGTPLLGHPLDLWGVLSSFGMEREVFGSWPRFLDCCNGQKGRWGGYTFGLAKPEAAERLRRVMLRRTRQEVLPDLPRKRRAFRVVNGVSAATQRRLDAVEEEWGDVVAAGELPPFEAISGVLADLSADLTPAVLAIAEEHEEAGEPLVVASPHRAPVDALAQRPGWASITGDTSAEQRGEIVRRFQAGELLGIALTIRAGGVGLTLTRAHKMVFAGLEWTPALNLQCEDRICRIGQQAQSCDYVVLRTDHPLHARVIEVLTAKARVIEAAVEAKVVPTIAGTPDGDEAVRRARADALEQVQRERDEEEARSTAENGRKRAAYLVRCRAEAQAPEMTPDLRAQVARNLDAMLDRCDGAETRDGQGFSKADIARSRWLGGADVLQDPEAAEMAWWLLRGYRRQVREISQAAAGDLTRGAKREIPEQEKSGV